MKTALRIGRSKWTGLAAGAAVAWLAVATTPARAQLLTRVSVNSSGEESDGWSQDSDVSGDGQFIVFASGASNLVAYDTNGWFDVFVYDRQTGVTT